MIEIVLLGQPRGKERPRLTKAGHVYTPEKTRDYEAALKFAACQAMAGRAPFEGAVRLDVVTLLPIPQSWPKKRQAAARLGLEMPTRKPDWENMAKMTDALNLVVWADDCQVVKGVVDKFYHDKPMMALRVTPLERAPEMPDWVRKHIAPADEGIFA